MNALVVAWHAWRAEKRNGGAAVAPRPTRAEAAFLPGVAEITAAPPPAHLVALPALIFVMLAIFVAWAVIGEIDVVSSARGRIAPSARVKVVQAATAGTVAEILVREGAEVTHGRPLMRLDPAEAQADLGRIRHDLASARVRLARSRALWAAVRGEGDPLALFEAPAHAPAGLVETERGLLEAQWASYRLRLATDAREVERLEAVRGAELERRAKMDATLPLLKRRVAAKETLKDKGLASVMSYLELKQAETELAGERRVLDHTLVQNAVDIARAREGAERTMAAELERLAGERESLEREIAALSPELKKAEIRALRQTLLAPADGIVHELQVTTVGAVVREADALMKIVPADNPLIVEARIENRDVGFVRKGLPVEVKVEAFPYIRYGTVPGEVIELSPDAEAAQQGAGAPAAGAAAGSATAAATPGAYKALIRIERETMVIEGETVRLVPGMAVTADVKTGKRHVIEYLLAPVLRYGSEGLRER